MGFAVKNLSGCNFLTSARALDGVSELSPWLPGSASDWWLMIPEAKLFYCSGVQSPNEGEISELTDVGTFARAYIKAMYWKITTIIIFIKFLIVFGMHRGYIDIVLKVENKNCLDAPTQAPSCSSLFPSPILPFPYPFLFSLSSLRNRPLNTARIGGINFTNFPKISWPQCMPSSVCFEKTCLNGWTTSDLENKWLDALHDPPPTL